MKKRFFLALTFSYFLNLNIHAQPAPFDEPQPRKQTSTQALLAQAKQERADSFEYCQNIAAEFIPTPDHQSYSVFWSPQPTRANTLPTLVSLHGHGEFAVRDLEIWNSLARKYQFNIIAIQWRIGQDKSTQSYYNPREIYEAIVPLLKQKNILPGTVFLHGFSRGASNVYALATTDQMREKYFRYVIANAGGATMGYPPTHAIDTGMFGPSPFSGTNWILYCGALDPNPDRDGCPAMIRTQTWLEKFGGHVDLLIQDQSSGHGGFHLNPANTTKALDLILPKLKKN